MVGTTSVNGRPINLLLIGPVPPEAGGVAAGGIATHVWELARIASTKGYKVTILEDSIRVGRVLEGIRILTFPRIPVLQKGLLGLKNWFLYYLTGRTKTFPLFLGFCNKMKLAYHLHFLEELMDVLSPDLVHLHNEHSKVAMALGLAKRKTPYVFTDHAFWQTVKSSLQVEKVKWTIAHAACLTYTSDYSLEKHKEMGIVEFKRRRKLLYPVAIEEFPNAAERSSRRKKALSDAPVILFVGVWEAIERKGLDLLLKAVCPDGYFTNHRVLVVTTKQTRDRCKVILDGQGGCIPSVEFFLPQEHHALSSFFSASDVFVLPSRSESYGIVYLEALLHGTPVVGFKPVIDEITRTTGTYVGEAFDANRESPVDLARKIKSVLRRRVSARKLRKVTREVFSWDTQWRNYDQLYAGVSQSENLKVQGE